MAQREIGLAAGEPPTTRGYPPSVFSMLPKLVERAGRTTKGSITAFYSVLVEGDDVNEPVSDAVRGLLDGHTILSRQLAARGHWPAVDILESISRLMNDITSKEHSIAATVLRKVMAAYRQHDDLISIGAYRQGSDPTVDTAIAMKDDIDRCLQQSIDDGAPFDTSTRDMIALANQCATQMNTNSGTLNSSPPPEA